MNDPVGYAAGQIIYHLSLPDFKEVKRRYTYPNIL